MGGAATRAVADIKVEDPDPLPAGATPKMYDDIIAQYESHFMTPSPAASELSRGEFHISRQLANKTILEWHARCRSLYMRGYPNNNARGTGDAGILLRERFTRGLESNAICKYIWDQSPAEYAAMLTAAQNKMATITMMATTAYEAKGAEKEKSERKGAP